MPAALMALTATSSKLPRVAPPSARRPAPGSSLRRTRGRLESVGDANHTEFVTDDNAGTPAPAAVPDRLFDHEKHLAEAKALVERRASEMRATEPGTAERDRAKDRVEEAMRRLRVRSAELQEYRADVEKARLRVERSVQRRRPTIIVTAVQAAVVVSVLLAGVFAGMMSVFAWIVVGGGAVLCTVQYAVARDDHRGGWPPAAATFGCVLIILAGLTALEVLPSWVGVPAALVAAGIATVIAADRFFEVDLLGKAGVKEA